LFPSLRALLSVAVCLSDFQRLEQIREVHQARIAQHNVHYLTLLRFLRGYKDDPKPVEKSIDMLGKMLVSRYEKECTARSRIGCSVSTCVICV
jgi:hypothetical protein